jgi:hypothetical protein
MKLGATRLTDSEWEKYMKEGKCFRCGKKGHRVNQNNSDGHLQKAILPCPFIARERRGLSREKITQQKTHKKKRTSALHSRYNALEETHRSEESDRKNSSVRRLEQKNIRT